MNTIKKYLKILLNSTKLVFNLTNLTKEEMAGHFSLKTKIRLFPKTTIRQLKFLQNFIRKRLVILMYLQWDL